MSEEIKNPNTQQQPTQPADNGNGAGEKVFTQDDVNRIVSERLARDRESRAAQQQNDDKETALKARESRFDCREYLTEQKYPVELLDLLDTFDVDKFKENVEKLAELFKYKDPRFVNPPKFTGGPGTPYAHGSDPIRDAFKEQT